MKLSDIIRDWGGDYILACPVCGFEYVHLLSVKVATGQDLTVVDSEGTRVVRGGTVESKKAVENRGARIVIEYWCEEGHRGKLILQFHEGIVFVEHEPLDPLNVRGLRDIWRD